MSSKEIVNLSIYVSLEEKEGIKKLASEHNKDVSTFLRERLSKFDPSDFERVVHMEALARLRKDLVKSMDELEGVLNDKSIPREDVDRLVKDIEKDVLSLRECMEKLA